MTQGNRAIVLLAAGHGHRFKGHEHKLMQPISDAGDTVLSRTLRHALESQLRVVVVASQLIEPVVQRWVARRDLVVLPATDARGHAVPQGMGHSIAAGVAAAGDADGWLILPGDMPLVQPATMVAVADGLARYPVCFAEYRGRQGHPVGFGTEMFSELLALEGDEGARRVVARFGAQGLPVDDPGVLFDVDTQDDFSRLAAAPCSSAG
ncbi:nucleotidyltransferase family protein [Roseateles paludis]|jgi:molybdenum cofactor cytidylyltransferase|uniref:Nucleotidyltransferase family protein n=1 Tax=Roseateles paludis TaxID=3145238 RepID=A0ABV0G7P2_9BURK